MPLPAPNRPQVRKDVAILAEALRGSPVLDALMRLAQIDGDISSVVEIEVHETVDTHMLARQLAYRLQNPDDEEPEQIEREVPVVFAEVFTMVKALKPKISSGDIDHTDIDDILNYIKGEQHG